MKEDIKAVIQTILCNTLATTYNKKVRDFDISVRKNKFDEYNIKIYGKKIMTDDIAKVLDNVYGLDESKIKKAGFITIKYSLKEEDMADIITLAKMRRIPTDSYIR